MSNVQHDCINLEYPSFLCCLYVTAWGFSPFLVNLFSNARTGPVIKIIHTWTKLTVQAVVVLHSFFNEDFYFWSKLVYIMFERVKYSGFWHKVRFKFFV